MMRARGGPLDCDTDECRGYATTFVAIEAPAKLRGVYCPRCADYLMKTVGVASGTIKVRADR